MGKRWNFAGDSEIDCLLLLKILTPKVSNSSTLMAHCTENKRHGFGTGNASR